MEGNERFLFNAIKKLGANFKFNYCTTHPITCLLHPVLEDFFQSVELFDTS